MYVKIISFFPERWNRRNIILPILLNVFFVSLFTTTVKGAGQLLCDSGFEDSTATGNFPDSGCWKPASAGGGAYAAVTTTSKYNGKNGLWIYTGKETWAYWSRPYQQFSASPGQIYYGSSWIRTPSGESWVDGSSASIKIEFLNKSDSILAAKNSGGVNKANSDWSQYTVTTDTAPTGTNRVRFICNTEKPNGVSGISVANFDDTYFELSIDNQPSPTTTTTPTPTPMPSCQIESISVSTSKLELRLGESSNVIVTLVSTENCPAKEGEVITAAIDKADSKRISISQTSAVTNSNGEATFKITAKNKIGNAKVTFSYESLKNKITVKIRK